jgi:Tol biopolymer transport system component
MPPVSSRPPNDREHPAGPTAPGPNASSSPDRLDDRLDSWKEIAAHLHRDVTTVQRWEKREGMPVHRHVHDRKGSVYASRAELDAWAQSRNLPPAEPAEKALEVSAPAAHLLWPKILAAIAVATIVLLIGLAVWLQRSEYFWRSPIADARMQAITDWDGVQQAAALSRDGNFLAFLSDRDGHMDVWVTQLGSGAFHNLTHGAAGELVNPSVRTLGFSPDGSLVTYWVRKPGGTDISVWAVPTLGGQPRPYLEGVAEYDWSHDHSRLAYHTPGPGDPLYVTSGRLQPDAKPILTAPSGLHSHFPLWSPDDRFIYFVQGSLPDKLDIWRITSQGGSPERITTQDARVTHPVFLDRRTLLYLVTEPDGSGPWLYSLDTERRIPHRLTSGLDRFTSLAATENGRHLAVTVTNPKRTLWRVNIGSSSDQAVSPTPISLTSGSGASPRLGADFLLYTSSSGTADSIWKLDAKGSAELWRGGAQVKIEGGPAISPDGTNVAFSVSEHGRTLLYAMRVDGTNARIVADSLVLQDDPAWSPDSSTITVAAVERGVPQLFQIPAAGGAPTPLVSEYALYPAWSPDKRFVLFSGPDVGTTFSVKAVRPDATAYPLTPLKLTRGARRIVVLPGGRAVVVLRGTIEHKDLWQIDLETGDELRLTNLPQDFDVRDFDISPDGRQLVLERTQDRSEIVLIELDKSK